jgi:N-dimethylarginine dimethylaminohydrolase
VNKQYGSQSMIAPLCKVLVKRPDEAFAVSDPARWNYAGRPNLQAAQQEHDALVGVLQRAGVEVFYHDEVQPGRADAVFVYDPAIVTERGAVVLSLGKELRRGEEAPLARRLAELGVPVHYRLHGPARADGGDLLWVDQHTLAVGQGFRTNAEGLRQIREALAGQGVAIMPVELPYHTGPQACLHLMSLVSIVDHKLAVVYSPLLSVPFWQYLRARGFEFVETPAPEFETLGSNVLALAPGHCLMLEGNPITQERLERAGCQVQTYRGAELSLKAEGGPTCLTRPILRGADPCKP